MSNEDWQQDIVPEAIVQYTHDHKEIEYVLDEDKTINPSTEHQQTIPAGTKVHAQWCTKCDAYLVVGVTIDGIYRELETLDKHHGESN